jgi:signal transduction histidine kinase
VASPALIAGLAAPGQRRKLRLSVYAGYGLAGVLLALAGASQAAPILATSRALYALAAFKLGVNTLAWLSLRRDSLVPLGALANLAADLTVITGAVYLTGAQTSPLHVVYAVEIAVVAMLFDRVVTVLTAACAIAMYAAMSLFVLVRALPAHPAPVELAGGVTGSYAALDVALWAALLGALTYLLSALQHALREKERALEQNHAALMDANRHKQQFMTNVTHELRSPIHGVLGLSELLRSGVYGELDDRQRDAVAGIEDSASSLLRLVDDLLAQTRADGDGLIALPREVALAPLLGETVESVRSRRGTAEPPIAVDVAAGLPVLRTDPEMLAHLVRNLLSNALKFTPASGRIALRARADGDHAVAIEIEDTGIGIPAAELPRVFEPFRQADGSSSRRFAGAGLGLAVVARLSRALGGQVAVCSAPEHGTAFRVTLPTALPK